MIVIKYEIQTMLLWIIAVCAEVSCLESRTQASTLSRKIFNKSDLLIPKVGSTIRVEAFSRTAKYGPSALDQVLANNLMTKLVRHNLKLRLDPNLTPKINELVNKGRFTNTNKN